MRKKERYEKVIAWFQANVPVAETELHYNNPYELLIAVILSAQCTDKRVNMITPPLYKDFPTPEALAASTPEVIFEYIRSVSYPNNKAKHLVGMAKMLVNDFNSKVPDNMDDLIKLPGVGRKTANVIQSVVFNKAAMAVDTHVFRVSHRIGLVPDSCTTPFSVEKELVKKLPRSADNYGVTENNLTIVRNGWGYTNLQIECEGEFVFTEKENITDDDFLGNRCRLPVYIDSSLCRPGKNFGKVYIYNAYTSLEIPVMVQLGDGVVARHADHSHMQCITKIMKYYEESRLKKIGTGTWLAETGKLVERMVTMDEKDVPARLFQAQLLITEERYNEAGWILDHAAEIGRAHV